VRSGRTSAHRDARCTPEGGVDLDGGGRGDPAGNAGKRDAPCRSPRVTVGAGGRRVERCGRHGFLLLRSRLAANARLDQ
jgi:hypothetical protein